MRRSLFLALTVFMVAAACGSSDDAATPTQPSSGAVATQDGGTVTVGIEATSFPADLSSLRPTSNVGTTRTAAIALARGYRITPELTFEPWLFDGDCRERRPDGTAPFTVSCTIKRDARWSDNVPVTADDFEFTWSMITNPDNAVITREGFNKIRAFTIGGDRKQFDMAFTEPYPAWRQIWSGANGAALPKHILQNADFKEFWKSCICVPGQQPEQPVGSGPFLVKGFTPTVSLEMVRNDAYWGPRPKLDKIVFRSIGDIDGQVNELRTGGVDVIYPTTITAAQKVAIEGSATFESALGSSWEHLDFKTDVTGLNDVVVRKAIATALPRQQIVDQLVKPINSSAAVLNSVFYMTNQQGYEPNWRVYPERGDLVLAGRMLDDAGYRLQADGVRAKGDVRLSFDLAVNGTNDARVQSAEIIKSELKKAGIDVKIDTSGTGLSRNVTPTATAYNFQTVLFAWTGGPDPAGQTFWRGDRLPPAGQNFTLVQNQALTDTIRRADAELDPAARRSLYNQADRTLAQDVVSSIPLFQRTVQIGYKRALVGPKPNATIDSFTWNVGDWAIKA
ncbi:MAG: ABC transporter substrate-binding protein [Acidimicrobiales bacterium]